MGKGKGTEFLPCELAQPAKLEETGGKDTPALTWAGRTQGSQKELSTHPAAAQRQRQRQDLFVYALPGRPSPPRPDRTALNTDDGHLHHCLLGHLRGLWAQQHGSPTEDCGAPWLSSQTHTRHAGPRPTSSFRGKQSLDGKPECAGKPPRAGSSNNCRDHGGQVPISLGLPGEKGFCGLPSTFQKKDGKAKLTMLPKIPEGVEVSGPCG